MAVFTEVSFDEADDFVHALNLGQLESIKGCDGGIENTNFFVDTTSGRYVLTLFERLTFEQLPFYLHLMKHLAGHGIPVPDPAPDAGGEILHTLKGKPAAVVNRLRGSSELQPGTSHCAQVGEMLARMHLAGLDYPRRQPNLRGLSWWYETVPVVLPEVTDDQRSLLLGVDRGNLLAAIGLIRGELAYQNHIAASSAYAALPSGPIHADLFRDNVMFDDGKLSGFFDFYFAGCDTFLFDIGVCLNDWCVDIKTGVHDADRAQAFLDAYQTVRKLTAAERNLLPAALRAGALRFWVSRLWDFHLPREAAVLQPHDPGHFERVLRERRAHPALMAA